MHACGMTAKRKDSLANLDLGWGPSAHNSICSSYSHMDPGMHGTAPPATTKSGTFTEARSSSYLLPVCMFFISRHMDPGMHGTSPPATKSCTFTEAGSYLLLACMFYISRHRQPDLRQLSSKPQQFKKTLQYMNTETEKRRKKDASESCIHVIVEGCLQPRVNYNNNASWFYFCSASTHFPSQPCVTAYINFNAGLPGGCTQRVVGGGGVRFHYCRG